MRSGELLEGVHYFRGIGSTSLVWCVELMTDWLACGGRTPAHQRSIEKFLATLPSNKN
jgi:hypothetical protein